MEKTCTSCSTPLEFIGSEQFRVGGTTGGWKLLFGEWAELGEGMIELAVWTCPKCRKVEFYLPEK
ncbi:hypothetical protein [Gelria sp. Kuro-4]|uniref:hypothetical protein n=1 Tax=Gelria sp. Kuro-4 TaxID=2796927 RepID=UPI001BF0A423|nr:hypothetical protein [Gelria sp. Kuro-4]BCV24492.1 hypothetical protein kuro4_12650 [Gelria sp. Kuro-4]